MKVVFSFFLIISVVYLKAVNLPVPTIISVGYNSGAKSIELKWICDSTEEIDGFIVYRTIFDQNGIADSAFMPVYQSSDKTTFEWNTTMEDGTFGAIFPDKRQYVFKIASYKSAGSKLEYSELSKGAAAPFIQSVELINCGDSLSISWKSPFGFSFIRQEIFFNSTQSKKFFSVPNDTNNLVIGKDYFSQADSFSLRLLVFLNATDTLFSNVKSMQSKENAYSDILMDSIITLQKEVTVYYTIQNLNDLSSVYLFRNQEIVDSFSAENNEIKIDYSSAALQLKAKDKCGNFVSLTPVFSPLYLSGSSAENSNRYILKMDYSYSDSSVVNHFVIWQNSSSQLVNSSNFYKSYTDENNEALPLKSYQAELTLTNSNNNHQTFFRSNELELSKNAIVEVPNAVNALSPNKKDHFFQVKTSFINKFKVIIFTNTGKKVFESDKFDFNWQAKQENDNIKQEVFYYTIQYTDFAENEYSKNGYFIVFY